MQLIKTPTKGMNDYLPRETRLREYVKSVIIRAYEKSGFSMIETPAVEHIENLTGKNGGENEKLIFKIMKRGEKLSEAADAGDGELCDSGLRYDLTVPLSRYYANNQAKLTTPFMAMQIGNVWRADRPQKGRFRQFTQCDIDILGDASQMAEITLISATTGVLRELGFDNFTVRINDRRLLKVCADFCGFAAEDCDRVFITLDKMDKIGLDGVKNELIGEGFDPDAVDKYISLYVNCDNVSVSEFASQRLCGNGADIAASLESIMRCATAATSGGCSLKFDPTLVRGMSYYTGTIFEISMDGYGYSVGGGGRYDEMLAKFSGQKTPACGFSLGFERIVAALADRGFEPPAAERSIAFLASKGIDEEKMLSMLSDAARLRAEGARVLVTPRMKNVYFQKNKLSEDGYTEFVEY
ncbi:MAG: histidine--tRNA ligase [Clostridiales bacterium]|nr:histidine--tRNA ligase [Clostridiales bacterium]